MEDGSVVTALKVLMGNLKLAPSSRGVVSEVSEDCRMAKDWSKTQEHPRAAFLSQRSFVSCRFPREVAFFFQTLSWVLSGTGNDPEVAQVRLVGCPRRHSRVPR